MKHVDVITIGSGGGAKITSPAASKGYKVLVVEKDKMGGTCLNRGCIPSKMLIHPADIARHIQEAKRFDISLNTNMKVDFAKLINRINATVNHDSMSIETSYGKHPNITLIKGQAKFIGPKTISVNGDIYHADKIFIAVGTRPSIPSIPGLAGTPYMTSTEALSNTQLPASMIVIGGGYIACELGYAYNAFGCKTTFLVRSSFLKNEDADITTEFNKTFSAEHDVRFGAIPTRVHYDSDGFTVFYQHHGEETSISAKALLIATGITSNVDTLDIAQTGVHVNEGNFIEVNDYLETNVPGIWAMGDCIGRYFFRHSVNFEGEYLFDTIFNQTSKAPIHYPPIPHAVFTNPQVAGVGFTEQELKNKNIPYFVGMNPYKSSAMGMALLSQHGFCKLLFCQKTHKILGGHMIGPEASNMIHMVIAYMNMNGTLEDMLKTIYIHPALPEIVRNAARKAKATLAS